MTLRITSGGSVIIHRVTVRKRVCERTLHGDGSVTYFAAVGGQLRYLPPTSHVFRAEIDRQIELEGDGARVLTDRKGNRL